MKRNRFRRFFQQKQYAVASLILFAAIAAMTGVYFSDKITSERQEEEMAQKEAELSNTLKNQQGAALQNGTKDPVQKSGQTQGQTKDDAKSVTSVIRPSGQQGGRTGSTQTDRQDQGTGTDDQKNQDNKTSQTGQQKNTGSQDQSAQDKKDQNSQNADTNKADTKNTDQKNQTAEQAKATSAKTLHFAPESDLGWPLQGDVILNYSMDQTVYFATLDQYKYNPAVIIAGKVNDPVKAAATGTITDISTNEETGMTVTMDLGDGYTAIYGQLKEVLYKEGATVETGNAIGYIAEPTKYYSVEGSNLYFALQKDNEPVNPMQYME